MSDISACVTAQTWELLRCGRLPLAEVEEVAQHLERCARCAEAVQALHLEGTWESALRARGQRAPAPPSPVVQQVMERLRDLRPVPASAQEPTLSFGGIEEDIGWQGTTRAAAGRPRQFPGYEILQELGRGGMGVVYKARHRQLDRIVALKMILAGGHASDSDLARFLGEARAIAQLHHPNIVQLFESGQQDGLPYFTMELVSGGSLSQTLRGGPLPPNSAARLIEQLAQAMHYAHQLGIVHRDLKPANILLQAPVGETIGTGGGEAGGVSDGAVTARFSGERAAASRAAIAKISDFGLAKRPEVGTGLTASGAVMGTPSYMAPEQAAGEGKHVGPPADVYALGAILYECLTGRPPFQGPTPLETVMQVISDEPVAPRQLQPRTPGDLETICLKCLQKKPGQRYGSAAELAEELRRFQAGEPIMARPVGALERGLRWCRRNKAPAAFLVSLVLGLITTAVLAVIAHLNANEAAREKDRADLKTTEAQENERAAKENQEKAETALVDMHTELGLMADERQRPAEAALWFATAADLAKNDPERQCSNRQASFFWSRPLLTPLRAFPHVENGGNLKQLLFHPGERYLLVVQQFNQCKVWDCEREEALSLPMGPRGYTTAAWNPDGTLLALGMLSGEVGLFRFPGMETVHTAKVRSRINALSFSNDGRLLAIGSNGARVWDVAGAGFNTPALPHPKPVHTLTFDPSNTLLVTSCDDQKARLFAIAGNAAQPTPLFDVPHDCHGTFGPWPQKAPLFLDQGRILVTTPGGPSVAGYEARTGKQLWRVDADSPRLNALVATPDRNFFAVGGDCTVDLRSAQMFRANGRRWGTVMSSKLRVRNLAFRSDGRGLLTASADRAARLWSVPPGDYHAELIHQNEVICVAYSPSGRLFATGQSDGLVRLWARRDSHVLRWFSVPVVHQQVNDGLVVGAAVSDDGSHFVPISRDRCVQLRKLEGGGPTGKKLELAGLLSSAAFSPDGRQLLTLSVDLEPPAKMRPQDRPKLLPGWIQCWDWRTGKQVFSTLRTLSEPVGAIYHPDGRSFDVLHGSGVIQTRDSRTGGLLHEFSHPDSLQGTIERVQGLVQLDPTGQKAGAKTRHVLLWDHGRKGSPILLKHDNGCFAMHFSSDGRKLASGADRSARIWDTSTATVVSELAHPGWVYAVCFDRHDRYLLTGCNDSMARLWDWREKKLVCPAFVHKGPVLSVAFAGSGRWAITASRDGTARIWDVNTGKPVTPPVPVGIAYSIHLTPDGRRAVFALSAPTQISVLSLDDLLDPPVKDLDVGSLRLLAELNAGQTIHSGGVVNLTSEDWLERWQRFRKAYPNFHVLPGESAGMVGLTLFDRDRFVK